MSPLISDVYQGFWRRHDGDNGSVSIPVGTGHRVERGEAEADRVVRRIVADLEGEPREVDIEIETN